MMKRKGYYFGTEIGEKWWRRYTKDKMFARGTGDYWYDSESFYVRRYLTQTPIVINYQDITEIKTGTWHTGQWGAGRHILNIV